MGSSVPVIPTIVWGSQRIYSKRMKRNFKHNKFPITVAFGEPFFVERGSDVDAAEADLKKRMVDLLHFVQDRYPDSHVGQRWAPARLGGTAPTLEEAAQEHAEFIAKKKAEQESRLPKNSEKNEDE